MAYKSREKPGVMLYWTTLDIIEHLSPEDAKKLLSGIYHYARESVEPNFSEYALSAVWCHVKPLVDVDTERYLEKCKQASKAGRASAENRERQFYTDQRTLTDVDGSQRNQPISDPNPDTDTNTNTDNREVADKPPRPRFVKPSIEEIQQYVNSENLFYTVPETFFDFYESNGWKVGRNPMRDWKRALNNWDRRELEKKRNGFDKPQTVGAQLMDMIQKGAFDE